MYIETLYVCLPTSNFVHDTQTAKVLRMTKSVNSQRGQTILHILHELDRWNLTIDHSPQTKEAVASAPEGSIGPGLVTQPLTMEQWASLDKVNEALTKEYSVRRQMLLTRCDVTVQSFRWSERAKVNTCN